MRTLKSTSEIRAFLLKAKMDFDSVENKALNDYLPKIFLSYPFTGGLCTAKQCVECECSKKLK